MTDGLTEAARASRRAQQREQARKRGGGVGPIEILLWKNRHGRLHVRLTASDRRTWKSTKAPKNLPPQTSYAFEFSWDAFQRNVYEFARMIGVEL